MNNKKLFLILAVISLLYTLPVYNKYWAPYDEGIITVAAQRLLAGELPYKDFFIVMYPPAQIYVLAGLLKVFSGSLLAGRIYTALVSVGISLLVFYMARALTKNVKLSLLSWFAVLVSSAPRLGAIPTPVWPGMFLGLFSVFVFMRFLENERPPYAFLAGAAAGLSALFRHDIGFFASAAIAISFFIKLLHDRKTRRGMALFASGVFFMILPCVVYFMQKSATKDMADSLLFFPFTGHNAAAMPFPRPCFDLNMIFHGSLHFIKVNQYYIPVLVYVSLAVYLLKKLIAKKLGDKENLMLLAILLFGVFTFNQVRVRTDTPHLLTVIQPAAVLFGFMLHRTFSTPGMKSFTSLGLKRFKLFRFMHFARVYTLLILALFTLLSIKNIDKYVKNTFRKVYKKDIIKTAFNCGTVYLPKEGRADLLNTIGFIQKATLPFEKIFLGNIAHWRDEYGGSLILYFLVNRLPSAKYYELVPGLLSNTAVQEEIKNSLLKHDVRLIVLQDIDLAADSLGSVFILDNFIRENYQPVNKFGKYNIYMQKNSNDQSNIYRQRRRNK
jgi:hypothetical protein